MARSVLEQLGTQLGAENVDGVQPSRKRSRAYSNPKLQNRAIRKQELLNTFNARMGEKKKKYIAMGLEIAGKYIKIIHAVPESQSHSNLDLMSIFSENTPTPMVNRSTPLPFGKNKIAVIDVFDSIKEAREFLFILSGEKDKDKFLKELDDRSIEYNSIYTKEPYIVEE